MSVDATAGDAKPAKNPIEQLQALTIAYATGGSAKEEFSYPGGYTVNAKNEFGNEMVFTFNGDIKIDVKPAPAS